MRSKKILFVFSVQSAMRNLRGWENFTIPKKKWTHIVFGQDMQENSTIQ